MAEALYRKYRPQIFEDVVGQEHIERTLKNAIAADKVSHAYLFTGPRGTGKTTTARLLSKALLCEQGPTPAPDGTCEDCRLVAAGEHPDVYELDAASRTGVENVREEIIGRVNYAPTRGRYKVYIIDEVHMLSTAAFNALLKTLEEPPAHVVFVLCTTDPQKVPETIHSRCQRFDFRRISNEELVSRLGAICEMEGVEYEGDALDLIAHRADGGMRDAMTSLEQLIAFGEGRVSAELAERLLGSIDSGDLAEIVRAIGTRDAGAAFRWTSEYMETGADLAQFVQDLSVHMRDMYVMQLAGADVALEVSEAGRRELESESAWFGPERLVNMLGVLGDLASELRTSSNQRLAFEIALTRMLRPDSDLTLAALAERVEALEAGVSAAAGVGVRAAGATGADVPQSVAVPMASVTPNAGVHVAERAVPSGDAVVTQSFAPVQATQVREEAAQERTPTAQQAAEAQTTSTQPEEAQPVQAQPVETQPTRTQLSAAQLSQLWATAMAHLKKTSAAYGVLLMNARPKLDEAAASIAVQFPADTEFAFQASQKPEVREALADALVKAGAANVPFTLEKATAGASAGEFNSAQHSEPTTTPTTATTVPTPTQEPQPDPAPVSAPQPDPAPTPTPQPEPTYDQLNDALAAAFGDGVAFTEVN